MTSSEGLPPDPSLDPMSEILDSYAVLSDETSQSGETVPSSEAEQRAARSPGPRTGSFLFGLMLIGVGMAAALAAQTGLTIAQSSSILLLACAATALMFLIIKASRRR